PFDNIVLVDKYLPGIAAVAEETAILVSGEAPGGPAFMLDPRPLTDADVANFVASHPQLTPPIQAILERLNITPQIDDAPPMNAALEAAGARGEVNGILARYGYSGLADWYAVNLATAHAYFWIAYVRSGSQDPFGAPPPPQENIAAVAAHFDEITALDIYHL